jgi:hypothetical protein
VAGAKTVTATSSFLYVTTVNADANDAVIFTLKSAASLATKTDATWAPPTITDITPSGLPNVDDTTTITGTNFASNVEVKFRKSDDSTLVTPKTTVRGSATSIIAGRPDSFAVGDAPYDVIVTNPTTTLSASSLNAITAGAVPVWVTSSTLNEATLTQAFSQTISATDADGSSTITYAIVSGALPTGLSLNTSTGAITGTPTGSTGSYTVTISDQSGNSVTSTFTPIEFLFTPGNFINITNLNTTGTPGFINPLDNYDVTLTAYIVAPDFSVCNQTLTETIAAVCDNQPFASLSNLYVGFDGVTIQYVLPGGSWPLSGTIPETIEIEIIRVTGPSVLVDSGSIDIVAIIKKLTINSEI